MANGLCCWAENIWLPWVPFALPWGSVLLGAFTALFILDVCVAVAKAFKLDRRLSQIDELAAALRVISDGLGETMASGALGLKATDQRARSEIQAASTRTRDTLKEADEKSRAEMKARYTELVAIFERDHGCLCRMPGFAGDRSCR